MTVTITREPAPVSAISVADTTGLRCVKIVAKDDGAMFEHDPDRFIGQAFLKPDELREVAAGLIDIADRADEISQRGMDGEDAEV